MTQKWHVLVGLDARPEKNMPFLEEHRLNMAPIFKKELYL